MSECGVLAVRQSPPTSWGPGFVAKPMSCHMEARAEAVRAVAFVTPFGMLAECSQGFERAGGWALALVKC